MDAQVQAADVNRAAAIQAARINFAANVMSNVGRSIARDIEHMMQQRY